MNEKLIKRILKQAQIPELLEVLAQRLSQSDLQSLLLEVYRARAQSLTPQSLLQQYEQNRLVQPAAVSPIQLLEFDQLAYSVLPPSFDPLELSPVCPFGTTSSVTPLDQNQSVTTIRNSEVCSDSTNVLALECARRRRDKAHRATEIKLCASHRLLRPQAPNKPGTFPHFRIFSLVTAGRDRGSYRFEVAALAEQLEFYLQLLQTTQQNGFRLGIIRVHLTVFDEIQREILKAEVIDKLFQTYDAVEFGHTCVQQQEQRYYTGLRFGIYAQDQAGTEYFLADGGFTDWTQQLLSDRKERLLISGIGSERFITCFGEFS
ncbi:hypothetical protein [Leptolyngbya sp. NIES-2104]|uniref:hypothetical protein n=1 Tax=Leptolyngbya sp. NIES-2104 TaxID=1552121 RepID=UPI0006EC6E92|nr:hypothetical protein [Leptolyngbya sp. NIES-2104]GAP96622.1 hypothetical protein NIES2104_31650 [Leptolyngbya sp. NIES-2104]